LGDVKKMASKIPYWLKVFGSSLAWLVYSGPLAAAICSTDANVAIPQGIGSATPGPEAIVDIVVPSSPGTTVTDLDFQLAINHTWVGDLVVTLTSPAGTTITLLDRPGTPPGTFGCGQNDIDMTFDDAAATLAVEVNGYRQC